MIKFRDLMIRTDDILKIVVFYGLIFFIVGFASGYLSTY